MDLGAAYFNDFFFFCVNVFYFGFMGHRDGYYFVDEVILDNGLNVAFVDLDWDLFLDFNWYFFFIGAYFLVEKSVYFDFDCFFNSKFLDRFSDKNFFTVGDRYFFLYFNNDLFVSFIWFRNNFLLNIGDGFGLRNEVIDDFFNF